MADVVAQSLLEKLQYPPSAGTRKRIKENFSLGMEDWDSDDSDFEPLARTKRKCNGESPKRFADLKPWRRRRRVSFLRIRKRTTSGLCGL